MIDKKSVGRAIRIFQGENNIEMLVDTTIHDPECFAGPMPPPLLDCEDLLDKFVEALKEFCEPSKIS
jgi:hypothetical protein